MFTIRKTQMDAISERLTRRFEDSMVVHLNTFFPERCEELGEEGVKREIAYGIQRAARYDITTERDVCKYLNFMFAYGRNFDVDPELPWASAILNDKLLVRGAAKTYLLQEASEGRLEPPYGLSGLPGVDVSMGGEVEEPPPPLSIEQQLAAMQASNDSEAPDEAGEGGAGDAGDTDETSDPGAPGEPGGPDEVNGSNERTSSPGDEDGEP